MSYSAKKNKAARTDLRIARKAVRSATRAVAAGARNRIGRPGPNWRSAKLAREVPDTEAYDTDE